MPGQPPESSYPRRRVSMSSATTYIAKTLYIARARGLFSIFLLACRAPGLTRSTWAGPPGVRGAWPARSRFEVLAGHLGWRQHHDSQPTLWQPRIGSSLSPQPPGRLASGSAPKPGSPDCPAPSPPTRWRSGWPYRRAEANSRLPQTMRAAPVLTPTTVTRLRLEPRARKPAGVDAHCACQKNPQAAWNANRPPTTV